MWMYKLYNSYRNAFIKHEEKRKQKQKKKIININLDNEWIFSLFISTFPMLLLLGCYLVLHWFDVWNYEISRIISIISASIWTYIGPIMIIRWIDSAKSLIDTIDKDKRAKGCAKKVWEEQFITKRKRNICFNIVWTLIVIVVLVIPSGREVLKSYYFYGLLDLNYWAFIICVSYVAYMTSFFFLFLWISRRIIIEVTKSEVVMSEFLLNEGKSNSLVLFGELISRTTIYFGSGLMFFPILITIFMDSWGIKNNGTFFVIILMGFYILAVLLYFFSMNKYVANKAQEIKDSIMENLTEESDKIETGSMREFILDQRIRYVASLNTNPVIMDQYLKLIYGIIISAFLPAIFALMLK